MARPGNFSLELTSKLTQVISTIPGLELELPEATPTGGATDVERTEEHIGFRTCREVLDPSYS